MSGGMISLLFLAALGATQATLGQSNPDFPSVAGHVLYKDGTPVRSAEVSFYGASMPHPVRTDENGYFSLEDLTFGEGVVTASKVSEGYPDAALAFYGQYKKTAYKSLEYVSLKEVRTWRSNSASATRTLSSSGPSARNRLVSRSGTRLAGSTCRASPKIMVYSAFLQMANLPLCFQSVPSLPGYPHPDSQIGPPRRSPVSKRVSC